MNRWLSMVSIVWSDILAQDGESDFVVDHRATAVSKCRSLTTILVASSYRASTITNPGLWKR